MRDNFFNYSYIWILPASRQLDIKVEQDLMKEGGSQRYELSSEKKTNTSGCRGQPKVTALRQFPAVVQFLPSSNRPFFAPQERGKKKQIDGNKIFNDRNENKLLLTFSTA